MDPIDILTPVAALLAFLGYVWLLSLRFWIGVILTLSVCYAATVTVPSGTEQLVYWGTATVLFATALVAMSFLPTPERFVVEVHEKKKIKVKPEKDIVIDGTIVIFWGGYANIGNLRMVVDHLREKAMMPYVFFDASSRHMARDALVDEEGFSKALGLEKDRVMICPSRAEADDFIAKFAHQQDLAIVSNDEFKDQAMDFQGLKLIKGIIADGHPILQEV